MLKRGFDIVFATMLLIILFPVIMVSAIAVKCDSKGPWLFRQKRVGLRGRTFEILKLRTMTDRRHTLQISNGRADARVTRVGKVLRKLRLDELPQLLNVIKGDMSIVGPRPEVEHFVRFYSAEQLQVLDVRPGITDPSSIYFRNEDILLDKSDDKEKYYIEELLPVKLAMQLEYVRSNSLLTDLRIIADTIAAMSNDLFKRINKTVYEK